MAESNREALEMSKVETSSPGSIFMRESKLSGLEFFSHLNSNGLSPDLQLHTSIILEPSCRLGLAFRRRILGAGINKQKQLFWKTTNYLNLHLQQIKAKLKRIAIKLQITSPESAILDQEQSKCKTIPRKYGNTIGLIIGTSLYMLEK